VRISVCLGCLCFVDVLPVVDHEFLKNVYDKESSRDKDMITNNIVN